MNILISRVFLLKDDEEESSGSGSASKRKRSTSRSRSPKKRRRSRSKSPSSNNRNNRNNKRSEHRLSRRDQEKKKTEICQQYMLGKCPKSPERCPYSHDADPPKIMELCKFYLLERCAKKEKCLYLHKGFPCKYFHTGM